MENRTFSGPDVRFDTGIEFCAPSWNRKRKYVSWNHWFTTKSPRGRSKKIEKTIRYKLYEIGYYAGSVILEIGLPPDSDLRVPIGAARDAGHDVQYFGIDSEPAAIFTAHTRLQRKQLASRAVFFQGSLSEFRNALPITPTAVIVNENRNVEAVLKHLALFLSHGTPVLVTGWFLSRSDKRSIPDIDDFEFCGRFGESVLLRSTSCVEERPVVLTRSEFQKIQNRFCIADDGELVQDGYAVRREVSLYGQITAPSGKTWPYSKNRIDYPPTLPDGTAWPRISIVTPSYNQGKYIEQTINSVLNQGYPNLEYIMIDGASTDGTAEILERYKSSFDHLISEPDGGQSDAINKGMKLATGDILTWLNSDDMLTAGTLFAMAMAFWKSDADMVIGAVQLMKDGQIVEEHLTSCENGPLELSELLDLDNNWLQGRFFYQPELMFTRDLWNRAGGYVDTSLYYSMDHELWLRFAIAGANMHVIGRPTVIYRLHQEQKTHADYQPELRLVNRRYIEKYGVPNVPLKSLQTKKYRVAFVNDVGPRYGAGIAHGRLRDAIDAAGHENVFICAKPSDAVTKTADQIYSEIEAFNPDLVVFGNLHNAGLGIDLVDTVSDRWATSLVLHDLWATTGRCCYSGSCDRHMTGCNSACPTAGEYPSLPPEQIETAFHRKLEVISKPRRIVLMANSEWTRQEAEKSAIGNRGVVQKLKYAFPTQIFEPRDKNVCREILGLPRDRFIVLFASVNVAEERKGLRHLFEALNRLNISDLLPVCIGHAHDKSALYPGTIAMGYVEDPWRAALIFAAADIFVGPSLQEAFGQVFIEAAACGTPAVAYNTGGVAEAIVNGVTGLHARQLHPSSLAEAINRLYADPEYRRRLAVWGRMEVENEWSTRSAYHHFNNLLRQIPEHLGFLPPAKIQFNPRKVGTVSDDAGQSFGILDKGRNCVLPMSGFCTPENFQHPDGTISKVQWATGHVSEMTVRIAEPGSHSVRLRCLNPCENQSINVYCNEVHVNTVQLPSDHRFTDVHEVLLVENIATGDHQLRLEYSHLHAEPTGKRNLALLFLGVSVRSCPSKGDSAFRNAA